ncbi:MAG: tRNA(Ile)-lysidine synthase [Methanomicrobiales archaeon]|nr:tRNA(Ile)-lysidine synthase [Methanomicrobiales archaeon]
MRCDKCRREAILFQRYSGLHLCRDHFLSDFEAKAKRAIRNYRWVSPGDRIGVAMSGGKDSSALFSFLHHLFEGRRDISLIGLTIDEGIAGYRKPDEVRSFVESYGQKWAGTSFLAEYGTTVDAIVSSRGDRLSCSYCGVLRRTALNRLARDAGVTKLAMGFNLDDEAQSVLMNILRGDTERLLRRNTPVPMMVTRVKPFMHIPEREVALYAYLTLGSVPESRCPYIHGALRAGVRDLLNDYTFHHPSTKYALIRVKEGLTAEDQVSAPPPYQLCPRCGEPSGPVCGTCRILDEVKKTD